MSKKLKVFSACALASVAGGFILAVLLANAAQACDTQSDAYLAGDCYAGDVGDLTGDEVYVDGELQE